MEIGAGRHCIDSDVLIDFIRGLKAARDFLLYENAHGRLTISAVSYVELWAGKATKRVRGVEPRQEIEKLEHFLDSFDVIDIDKRVARRAGELRREYDTPFADAIIAASAMEYNLNLVTKNVKHFEKISKSEGLTIHTPY